MFKYCCTILLSIWVTFSTCVFGQTTPPVTVSVNTQAVVTVCEDGSQTFQVDITNNTDQPLAAPELVVNKPIGLISPTVAGRNLSTDTELTPTPSLLNSTENTITYQLPTTMPAKTLWRLVLTFRSDCRLLSSVAQTITNNTGKAQLVATLTYNNNTERVSVASPSNEGFFNVLYPDMETSLLPTGEDSYQNITLPKFEKRTRTLQIRNTGLGKLSRFDFQISYENNSTLKIRAIRFLGQTVFPQPVATPQGGQVYTIPITNFGELGETFDTGEIITLYEDIEVIGCNITSMRTDYQALWGCEESACNAQDNDSKISAYVSVPSGNPQLKMALGYWDAANTTVLDQNSLPYTSPVQPVLFRPGARTTIQVLYQNIGEKALDRFTDMNLVVPFDDGFIVENPRLLIRNKQGVLQEIPVPIDPANPGTRTIPTVLPGDQTNAMVANYRWEGQMNQYTYRNGLWIQLSKLPTGVDLDEQSSEEGLSDLDKDGIFDDLGPNQSVTLLLDVTIQCVGDLGSQTVPEYGGKLVVRPGLYTQTDCGGYGPGGYAYPDFYYNFLYPFGAKLYIDGPTDLLPGQSGTYQFSAFGSLPSHTDGFFDVERYTFQHIITVPKGYRIKGARWKDWRTIPIPDDAIKRIPDQNKIVITWNDLHQWVSTLEADFDVDCNANLADLPNITYERRFIINPEDTDPAFANCFLPLAAGSYPVYGHCKDCSGQFTTTNFTVERTTLGWPAKPTGYYTWDELDNTPQLQIEKIEKTKYNLSAAYAMDAIEAVASGQLTNSTDGYSDVRVRLSYDLPATREGAPVIETASGFFELKKAYFQIDGTSYPLDISQVTFAPTATGYEYIFILPATATGRSRFTASGKPLNVDLIASFKVRDLEAILPTSGVYRIPKLRAFHYGTNPSGQLQGCSDLGVNFNLYRPYIQVDGGNLSSYECNNNQLNGERLIVAPANVPEDFPGEFRPLVRLNEVAYVFPPNSETVKKYSIQNLSLQDWYPAQKKVSILPQLSTAADGSVKAAFSTTGTTLVPITPLYTGGYNQFLTLIANKNYAWLSDQEKMAKVAFYNPYECQYTFTLHPYSLTASDHKSVVSTGNLRFFYDRMANWNFRADAIQEGFGKQVTWNVKLCNPFNYLNTNATNAWIAFEPELKEGQTVPQIKIESIQTSTGDNIPFTTQLYGPEGPEGRRRFILVQLGDLNTNQCQEFRVNASYVNCVNDAIGKVDVHYGWSCENGYPAVEGQNQSVASFIDTEHGLSSSELQLRYKTSNFQWEVTQEDAQKPVAPCSKVPFDITLASTKTGDIFDVKIGVDLPVGVTLKDNKATYSYEYLQADNTPATATGDLNLTDAVSSTANGVTTYIWTLAGQNSLVSQLPKTGAGESYLPGTRVGKGNILKVHIDLQTGCTFDSGKNIRYTTHTLTNCGDKIDLNWERKLQMEGVPQDELAVESTYTGIYTNCDYGSTNDQTITLTNRGLLPTSTGKMKIVLPSGILFSKVLGTTPQPSAVNENNVTKETTLEFPVAAGLVKDASVTYQLQTSLDKVQRNSLLNTSPAIAVTTYVDVPNGARCTSDPDCKTERSSGNNEWFKLINLGDIPPTEFVMYPTLAGSPTDATCTGFTFRWYPVVGATAYQITAQQSLGQVDSNGKPYFHEESILETPNELQQDQEGRFSYTFKKLQPGTYYYYRVYALKNCSKSDWNGGFAPTAPKPERLAATLTMECGKYTVQWNPPPLPQGLDLTKQPELAEQYAVKEYKINLYSNTSIGNNRPIATQIITTTDKAYTDRVYTFSEPISEPDGLGNTTLLFPVQGQFYYCSIEAITHACRTSESNLLGGRLPEKPYLSMTRSPEGEVCPGTPIVFTAEGSSGNYNPARPVQYTFYEIEDGKEKEVRSEGINNVYTYKVANPRKDLQIKVVASTPDGCERVVFSDKIELKQAPTVDLKFVRMASCESAHDGILEFTSRGASGYKLVKDGKSDSDAFTSITGNDPIRLTNLGVGTYTVIVENTAGCTTQSAERRIEKGGIELEIQHTSLTCNGEGKLWLKARYMYAPSVVQDGFKYRIIGPGNKIVVTDQLLTYTSSEDGLYTPGTLDCTQQAVAELTGLQEGTYKVEVYAITEADADCPNCKKDNYCPSGVTFTWKRPQVEVRVEPTTYVCEANGKVFVPLTLSILAETCSEPVAGYAWSVSKTGGSDSWQSVTGSDYKFDFNTASSEALRSAFTLPVGDYVFKARLLGVNYECVSIEREFKVKPRNILVQVATERTDCKTFTATAQINTTANMPVAAYKWYERTINEQGVAGKTPVLDPRTQQPYNTASISNLTTGKTYLLELVFDATTACQIDAEFTLKGSDPFTKPIVLTDPRTPQSPQECTAKATVVAHSELLPGSYTIEWYRVVSADAPERDAVPVNPDGNMPPGMTPMEVFYTEQVSVAASSSLVSTLPESHLTDVAWYQAVIYDQWGCRMSTSVWTELFRPVFNRAYALCMQWETPPLEPAAAPEPVQTPAIDAVQIGEALDEQVGQCLEAQRAALRTAANPERCLDGLPATAGGRIAALTDKLTLSYDQNYHHFTLYYYDRAGNLTKTVPPEGVDMTFYRTATGSRLSIPTNPAQRPRHTLQTEYDYNSLGQLMRQNTPDGGTTHFVYNQKGLLRFSQNARQKAENAYSYTKYDHLSRVVEVGEAERNQGPFILGKPTNIFAGPTFNGKTEENDHLLTADQVPGVASAVQTNSMYPVQALNALLTEQTITVYSDPFTKGSQVWYTNDPTKPQRYLRNRVSYSYTLNKNATQPVYTFYSYDAHGNVEWLCQQLPDFGKSADPSRRFFVGYEYDLISGKVLKVSYNEHRPDRFYHRYSYDEDNRLTRLETSTDNLIWDTDSRYRYYAHGPLRRMEIGQDKVQGLDYVYTIHGWLKGINTPTGELVDDAGRDSDGSLPDNVNRDFAKDEFGMMLGYYRNDYHNQGSVFDTGTPANPNTLSSGLYGQSGYRDLYNGNISLWADRTYKREGTASAGRNVAITQANLYQYDRLNRIKASQYGTWNGSSWSMSTAFASSYTYDGNGNILTLTRNDEKGNVMDNLRYSYNWANAATKTGLVNNQLDKVEDLYKAATPHPDDITDIHDYSYDDIGNLIADSEVLIEWNVYGKVSRVIPKDAFKASKPLLDYLYDATGNRIGKGVTPYLRQGNSWKEDTPNAVWTYYSRDAQGNILATYQQKGTQLTLDEEPLYGSDRVGMRRGDGQNLNGQVAKRAAVASYVWEVFENGQWKVYPSNSAQDLNTLQAMGKVSAGSHTYRLTLTDANGLSSSKELVVDYNSVPVVRAVQGQALSNVAVPSVLAAQAGTPLTVRVLSSDADADAPQWQWTASQQSGSGVASLQLQSSTSVQGDPTQTLSEFVFQADRKGVYGFVLELRDGEGHLISHGINFQVSAASEGENLAAGQVVSLTSQTTPTPQPLSDLTDGSVQTTWQYVGDVASALPTLTLGLAQPRAVKEVVLQGLTNTKNYTLQWQRPDQSWQALSSSKGTDPVRWAATGVQTQAVRIVFQDKKKKNAPIQLSELAVYANERPMAIAYAQPGSTAGEWTLNGSQSSDVDGKTSELTYRWVYNAPASQTSSLSAPVVETPTQAVSRVRLPVSAGVVVAGRYVFELQVSDATTEYSRTQVVIEIGANQPPVVDAGSDRVVILPVSSLTLKGRASDADADPIGYAWEQKSGPASTLNGVTSAELTVTGLQAGLYIYQLTATAGGVSSSDQVRITVGEAGAVPYVEPIGSVDEQGNLNLSGFGYGSRQLPVSVQRIAGQKSYELKDHLGNVRTVVSDAKYLTELPELEPEVVIPASVVSSAVVLPASGSNTSIGSGAVFRMDKNQSYTNQTIKLDGGTLLVEGSTDFQISNLNLELKSGKVYISKGAKVKIPNLNLNTPAHSLLEVINVGELESENVNLNGESRLVNGGTLQVNQSVSINDAKAAIVNQGTLIIQSGLSSNGQIENNGLIDVKSNQVSLNGGSYVASMESKLVISGNLTVGNVSLQGPIQAGVYAPISVGGNVTINNGNSKPVGNLYLSATGTVSDSQSVLGQAILTLPTQSISQLLAAAQLRANVLSFASYYAFGALMPTLEYHKIGYRWGYNGKERDKEGMGGGGSTYDYGARIYNSQIGRFLSIDPLSYLAVDISPFAYSNNSPISFLDEDGRFTINVHEKITKRMLAKLKYSKVVQKLLGHYASVYADHPSKTIRVLQANPKRDDIDYSETSKSQDTSSPTESTRHSMQGDNEDIGEYQAMRRGLEFGWSKIFEAIKEGKIESFKKNSKGAQAFGVGVHALQDAQVHKGVKFKDHDHLADFGGNRAEEYANSITESAIVVMEIMQGNYTHLQANMELNVSGMPTELYTQLKNKIIESKVSNVSLVQYMPTTFQHETSPKPLSGKYDSDAPQAATSETVNYTK